MSVIESVSRSLGVSDAALRLLLTVLGGYPVAVINRVFINNQSEVVHHLYSLITGIAFGYFNFGLKIGHCLITIIATYIIVHYTKGKLMLTISWLINFVYLCVGYYLTETDDYDILWTMPQCVLCLRLIGLTFDIYDSFDLPPETRVANKKSKYLTNRPTFLEIFGYSMFPTSFLVGPQFPFARYLRFVKGQCEHVPNNPATFKFPDWSIVAPKLIFGLIYLGVVQIGGTFISQDYFFTEEFKSHTLLVRLFYVGVWGRLTLYKYLSVWLLTEGACICYGIAYNGRDANNQILWNGCENVNIKQFENVKIFNDYIACFNINTNHWVAEYVYKRLKFLGNRLISQAAALLFLSTWHGFHSGYYVTFAFEFFIILFERKVRELLKEFPLVRQFLATHTLLVNIVQRYYTLVFMGYSLIPFAIHKYVDYRAAYENTGLIGFYMFLLWPIYFVVLRQVLKGAESLAHTFTRSIPQSPSASNADTAKSELSSTNSDKSSTKADISPTKSKSDISAAKLE